MGKWGDKSIEGQGYSLNLCKGHSDFKIQTCFLWNLWVIWNQISFENPWEKENDYFIYQFSHITKFATMTIYSKNLSKIFHSRTSRPIAMKLGMHHKGLGPIKVCSNDDPVMFMNYYIPRSKLVTKVFNGKK